MRPLNGSDTTAQVSGPPDDPPAMGLDSSRLRLRVQVIGAGVWVTYLFSSRWRCGLVATWDRPHRGRSRR